MDVNASSNAVRLGVPHALFQAPAAQRQAGAFDVTADGKKLLINSGNQKEGNEPVTLVLNWPAELKKGALLSAALPVEPSLDLGSLTAHQESCASGMVPPKRKGTHRIRIYIDEERYRVDQLEGWKLGRIATTSRAQTKTRGQR